MSEIGKRIDALIASRLAPLLKDSGFEKRGRKFKREHSDHFDLVSVQASRYNLGKEGKFTLNIGVHYPELSALQEVHSDSVANAGTRIGWLMPVGADYWWELDEYSDDDTIARDVATQVRQWCLPWLDRMSDLEEVKAEKLKWKQSFLAAGIALYQGRMEEATKHLNTALSEQPTAKVRIEEWAAKHGLAV